MAIAGYLKKQENSWAITVNGLARLRELEGEKSVDTRVKSHLHRPVSGTYDGRELKNLCVRPGAYDAYKLPSMMAGQPVASKHRDNY